MSYDQFERGKLILRSLIVFGNGLGMALDSSYFSLEAGLRAAWSDSSHFTIDHRLMVATAVPGVSADVYPESEEQLDKLQMAIVASDFLASFETTQVQWLSDASRQFPQAFRYFIHEVASYFHESGQELPSSFTTPLAEFIFKSKSHVAILNYDNLLYDAFRKHKVTNGFYGTLIDGFQKDGFSPDNLDRYRPEEKAWYLHLHGSPLFIGNTKIMGSDRSFLKPTDECHIVLTHVAHKPTIIDASPILSEYWRRLDKAVDEAEMVILVGYSGEDLHLNDKLNRNCGEKPVHIIEWSGSGELNSRVKFWDKMLEGCNGKIHHFDNILDFVDWKGL